MNPETSQTINGSNETHTSGTGSLLVRGVRETPSETWDTLLRFSGPDEAEKQAMLQTVDTLFQRGHELVVGVYEHLRNFPETAEVLGWQIQLDEVHLAERRRFFTIWLARTLSMDYGSQFADYLFHAGKVHAAHGKRRIETPSMWITGSVGLITGAFAKFIADANQFTAEQTALALSGWNKYLLVQLNQMHIGYEAGCELNAGTQKIEVKTYAMVRHHLGLEQVTIYCGEGAIVADILRKLLNFAPELRHIMFDPAWESNDADKDLWLRVEKHYQLREGWRVQLNGKNLTFHGGFDQKAQSGDLITLFSPGR